MPQVGLLIEKVCIQKVDAAGKEVTKIKNSPASHDHSFAAPFWIRSVRNVSLL